MGTFLIFFISIISLVLGEDALYERQEKVDQVVSGLSRNIHTTHPQINPLPFEKPELFKNEKVLENFLSSYRRGMLNKDGVFTMNCPLTLQDTLSLFNLLYFAKDFDTFMDISMWAKNELQRVQFYMAFCLAMEHREDTRDLYSPPLYQVFPDYFVPAEIMHRANIASLKGITSMKFQVNNTGYEWSWHRNLINGYSRRSNKWNGDDTISRMSYYREDVTLSQSLVDVWTLFAPLIASPSYPDIKNWRIGELVYQTHKFYLARYNLERSSNGLPPVKPLDHDAVLDDGFDSSLADLTGRMMSYRPAGLIPSRANPDGIERMRVAEARLFEAVDIMRLKGMEKGMIKMEGREGIDQFAKVVFARADSVFPEYYKPLFFLLLEAYDNMLTSSNDRDYRPGILGYLATASREPLFYRILATAMKPIEQFQAKLPPYTKQEVGFPGVDILSVDVTELMTTFDRHDFSINEGIEKSHPGLNMVASQFRLNNKPFSYTIKIKSDKKQMVYVKAFIGPKTDTNGLILSLDQSKHLFYAFSYLTDLSVDAGENTINVNYTNLSPIWGPVEGRDGEDREKIRKAKEENKPFPYKQVFRCRLPISLVLPRGWKSGKEFRILFIVKPILITEHESGYFPCHHNVYPDDHTDMMPLDRRIVDESLLTSNPNIFVKDVTIFNEY